MADYRLEFKYRKFGFGNIAEKRAIRADYFDEQRKVRRTEHFSKHRNLEMVNSPSVNKKPEKPVDSRKERLLLWKKERDLRNKLKKQQAKPVFKVGVIHHKIYSPAFLKPSTEKSPQKEIPKRITRATQKRLAAKAAQAAEQSKKLTNVKHNKKVKTDSKPTKQAKKSFAPEGYKFKPPPGLPQMPAFNCTTPGEFRFSGTTQWFVSDLKNDASDTEEATKENSDSEEKYIFRFGRPSAQKLKYKKFSIFDFNTPAVSKNEITGKNLNEMQCRESPRKTIKKSILTNFDGHTNKVTEDDHEVFTPAPKISRTVVFAKTPTLTKTPKAIKIENEPSDCTSDKKSPKPKRRIKIKRNPKLR